MKHRTQLFDSGPVVTHLGHFWLSSWPQRVQMEVDWNWGPHRSCHCWRSHWCHSFDSYWILVTLIAMALRPLLHRCILQMLGPFHWSTPRNYPDSAFTEDSIHYLNCHFWYCFSNSNRNFEFHPNFDIHENWYCYHVGLCARNFHLPT